MSNPQKTERILSDQLRSIVPPLRSYGKIFEKEATLRTKTQRPFGQRPILEKMFLRPSLESVRGQYLRLIANAMASPMLSPKQKDIKVQQFINEGRAKGLYLRDEDLRVAKGMATSMTNVED
jgi:hypothetical protein